LAAAFKGEEDVEVFLLLADLLEFLLLVLQFLEHDDDIGEEEDEDLQEDDEDYVSPGVPILRTNMYCTLCSMVRLRT
jgi:hypothetical protein